MSPTKKRFWSMFLCGLLAAALYGAMQPLFHTRWMEFYIERLGDLGGTPLVAIFVVAGIIIAGIAGRGRIAGFLGLHHLPQFPPLWVAVTVGMLTILLSDALFHNLSASKEVCAIVVWWLLDDLCDDRYKAIAYILLLLILVAVALCLSGRELGTFRPKRASGKAQEDAEKPVDLNELAKDVDKLIAWFENDDPITDPKQDAFEHGRVAKHIADRLAHLADGTIDASEISTALIGPIGSGKSSIMRMVQEDLLHRPKTKGKIAIVDISMWPYTTAEAAVQGVIDRITHELGKHINILGLRNTSRHYLRAIQTTGGWLGAFGHLLDDDATPANVLHRLNDAAEAIDLNIVIWMEDQERFIAPVGKDDEEKAQAIREGVARLAPMHALLYEIDCCKKIGVVWADVGMDLRFDEHKITRNQEYVPRLTPRSIWDLIWCLRRSMLKGKYGPVEDIADSVARIHFKQPKAGVETMAWTNLMESNDCPMTLARAVAEVIQTPRQLKTALRLFNTKWRALNGDVDIDDLLVMSVFQCVKPELVDYCNRHYEALAEGLQSSVRLQGDETASQGQRRGLDALTAALDGADEFESERFHSLIKFVFPFSGSTSVAAAKSKPQGLGRERDYWTAFLHLERPRRPVSDQVLIRAITDYLAGNEDDLLNLMLNLKTHGRISAFSMLVPMDQRPNLFRAAMERVTQQPVEPSRDKRTAPLWSFCGLVRETGVNHQNMSIAVQDVIDSLLPTDLYLAHQVWSLFARQDTIHVLEDAESVQVLGFISRRVFEDYGQEDPVTLVDALRTGDEELLDNVLDMTSTAPVQKNFATQEQWDGFVRNIFHGVKNSRQVMLPQIAYLLTRNEQSELENRAVLDTPKLKAVFGELTDELLEFVIATPAPPSMGDIARAKYHAIQRDAVTIGKGEVPEANDPEQ